MDINQIQLELKKGRWNVEQLIAASLDFLQVRRGLILSLTLMIFLPLNIVLTRIPIPDMEKLIEALSTNSELPLRPFTNYFIIYWLISLIGSLATYVIAIGVDQYVRAQSLSYNEALLQAIRLWPWIFVTGILKFLLLIPLTLIIVPGIIFSVYWIFSTFAVLLRDSKGMDALRYSKRISAGAWGHVGGTYFLLAIFSYLAVTAIGVVSLLLPPGAIANIVSGTLGNLVSTLFVVAQVFLFLNLEALAAAREANNLNLEA